MIDDAKMHEVRNGMERIGGQRMEYFGVVRWQADDVKSLRPKWSKEKCEDFLERHSGHIQDAMCATGWNVIECALGEEKQ